jgi:hypothetical protein
MADSSDEPDVVTDDQHSWTTQFTGVDTRQAVSASGDSDQAADAPKTINVFLLTKYGQKVRYWIQDLATDANNEGPAGTGKVIIDGEEHGPDEKISLTCLAMANGASISYQRESHPNPPGGDMTPWQTAKITEGSTFEIPETPQTFDDATSGQTPEQPSAAAGADGNSGAPGAAAANGAGTGATDSGSSSPASNNLADATGPSTTDVKAANGSGDAQDAPVNQPDTAGSTTAATDGALASPAADPPSAASSQSCTGWESDPQSFSKRIAETFAQDGFNTTVGPPDRINCSGKQCVVHYEAGQVVPFDNTVDLSQVPGTVLASGSAVPFMMKPQRCSYSYTCDVNGSINFKRISCTTL